MIRIGITQRALPPTEFGEIRDALDRQWHRFLQSCDMIALPLPNEPETALVTASNFGIKGIVLSGGEDLVSYGGEPRGRDETEYKLLEWAFDKNMPVIGICRGMQLILDAYGSQLYKVENHIGCRHKIITTEGPRIVNSYHQWAALEVVKPLIVTAMSGSVVEAIKHSSAPIFGFMWHPERNISFDAIDVAFFKEVFGG